MSQTCTTCSAELESEIRQTNHPERIEWKFQRDKDRECYLAMLLSEQKDKTYLHKPSNRCKERGGYCMDCIIISCMWSIIIMQDVNSVSLWMDTFPHCLFPVKATFPGLPMLNMPNVCTEQLKPKSAFCVYHTEIAIDRGYPTTI